MSDELPIAQVPESTWLRVLAHALDPDTDAGDESLVPSDDGDPQADASGSLADDVDPWDEDSADDRASETTVGDEAVDAGDDLGGWGDTATGDDILVADGEAAVDNYTAALPEEHDDRDAPDDSGW